MFFWFHIARTENPDPSHGGSNIYMVGNLFLVQDTFLVLPMYFSSSEETNAPLERYLNLSRQEMHQQAIFTKHYCLPASTIASSVAKREHTRNALVNF